MDGTLLDKLIIALAIAAILAGAVERLVEMAKPLLAKIKNPAWLASAKIASAIVFGFGMAALTGFDFLKEAGWAQLPSPWIGYIASAMVLSLGGSIIHPLLEILKIPKQRADAVTAAEVAAGKLK